MESAVAAVEARLTCPCNELHVTIQSDVMFANVAVMSKASFRFALAAEPRELLIDCK